MSVEQMYQENILDHYRNPRNFGQIDKPDVDTNDYNPLCGDKIGMQLKISGNKIKEIKFYGSGCAISQASASMLTEEISGKTIQDILKLTKEDVLDLLGIEISYARLKCALLALKVLKMAVYTSEGRKFDISDKDFGL